MSFPWTLQRYIFREMGQTFLLAAAALTAVLGLGGGVMNMVKLGDVTPAQLARLMALLLPLAAGLTLPIAALFSAAVTYGRLSADNEFTACRSCGINMHILFLPTVVLSLLSAGASFGLTNFLIPGMMRNLNELIGADVGALVQQRLNGPRGITLGGKFRIHADECVSDPSDPERITLMRIAFVEVDGDEWVRFGTAREVRLFFHRDETRIRVSGSMKGLSYYDRKRGGFFEEVEQTIPPNDIPSPVPHKIKFLNLNELFNYWSKPTTWYEVRRKMQRLRMAAGRLLIYDALWEEWQRNDHVLTLSDDRASYVIRSNDGGRIPYEGGIELTDVTVEEQKPGRRRSITALRAAIEVTRADTIAESGIQIVLREARLRDGTTDIHRAKVVLGPLAVPPPLVAEVEAFSDAELLHPAAPSPEDPLAEERNDVWEARGETVRRIVGTISERLAFSVSVFVLVILGAALGIIFRGSHIMTAFGISFVPMLFVIIAIVMGRQMSHNAGTHVLGLLVMWSGIVIVFGLDVWTLVRVLRR